MTEKKVKICDVCDKHTTEYSCEICGKDICEECSDDIMLSFIASDTMGATLFNIHSCKKCNKQFSRVCLSEENIFEDSFKELPELRKAITDLVKNVMMLKKVSDEKDDDIEDEDENISLYPPLRQTPLTNPIFPPYKHKPFTPFKHKYYTQSQSKMKRKKWWGGDAI